MKPVFQTVVDRNKGNCMQAAVASILELDIDQVPNFVKFDKDIWYRVFCNFFWAHLWDCTGFGTWEKNDRLCGDIDGYILTAVKSRQFAGNRLGHLLIMDRNRRVVHDPNPNGQFLHDTLLWDEIVGWYIFERTKGE